MFWYSLLLLLLLSANPLISLHVIQPVTTILRLCLWPTQAQFPPAPCWPTTLRTVILNLDPDRSLMSRVFDLAKIFAGCPSWHNPHLSGLGTREIHWLGWVLALVHPFIFPSTYAASEEGAGAHPSYDRLRGRKQTRAKSVTGQIRGTGQKWIGISN